MYEPMNVDYGVDLIQVAAVVSAAVVQLDGPGRGGRWNVHSYHTTIQEFLATPHCRVSDGTPIIRLDLTNPTSYARAKTGPRWKAELLPGTIGWPHPAEYHGETWQQLADRNVAADVYARLAPTVGIVVHRYRATSR